MTAFIQVLTTTEKREHAQRIARELVEARLAACVQIVGPIESFYRWQGNLETAEEFQCLIKTRVDLFPRVKEMIRRLHTYQVPEIVATEIADGGKDYIAWLDQQLLPPE